MIDDVPQGWVGCQIGDISHVIGGGTPDAGDLTNFSTTSGIPWLTPADLSGYKEIYVSRGKRFLTKKGFEHSSAKLMPRGAVLFSSRAPIGYVAVATNEICTNQGFRSFVCADGVSPEYLYFWLKYAKPLAEELASGTTFAEISGTNAAKIPLLLAPVAEQQRIAARLKKLLDHVDTCQQRLAKIPTLLKHFRKSVLAAACSGRLTADWREENQPGESGEELLRRIVRDRRSWWEESQLKAFRKAGKSPKDDRWKAKYVEPASANADELETLPDSWTWGTWDQASNWVTYGFTRPMPHVKDGIPIVTARHVLGRKIELTETDSTTRTAFDDLSAKDRPMIGDLLITKDGSIGRAALVESEVPFCINQSVAVVWLRSLTLDRKYLLTAVEWPYTQNCIAERARGAAIQHLSITDFAKLPLPIPSLAEQQEIVRRVENLFALADRIEARFAEGRRRVNSVTQAILAKAFRGELVPTEAELASREGRSYESASELLDRIRSAGAGRSNNGTGLKHRKPRRK